MNDAIRADVIENELRGWISILSGQKHESDRGVAIVIASIFDERITSLLKLALPHTPFEEKIFQEMSRQDGPLGTFKSKTDLFFLLGMINEVQYRSVNLIRKIRNQFAHSAHLIKFSNPEIEDICRNLKYYEIAKRDPRMTFIMTSAFLFMELSEKLYGDNGVSPIDVEKMYQDISDEIQKSTDIKVARA